MKTPKQNRREPVSPMSLDALLSPQWAFVVQFRAVPGGPVYAAGRVEHLVSGRTAHFQSLQELTTYFDKNLQAIERH